MPATVYIPLEDSSGDCVQYYITEYKAASDPGYSTAPQQFASPIMIAGLIEGVEYEIRITKVCCNGQLGTPVTTTYTVDPSNNPVTIYFINNATTGPTDANIGIGVSAVSPVQNMFSGDVVFIQSLPNMVGAVPLDNTTTMPAEGDMYIINHLGNAVDYDYTISITDGNDDPIGDSSFPYTGTILSNQTININSVVYGTSTNGYKITYELSDAS